MTTGACTSCGGPVRVAGPEPPAGRYCSAPDCQRERHRVGNRLRGTPVIRPCVVCQQPIPAERRRRATCSEPCEVERARETAREHYRRLVAAIPDYNVIRGERIRARAAADPEYAARIREGWRVRGGESRRALLRPIEVFDEAHRGGALSRRFELEREYPGEHVASLGANGPDHLRASFATETMYAIARRRRKKAKRP